MRKGLAIIITSATCFTAIFAFLVFSFSYIASSKGTSSIFASIDTDEIIEEAKKDNTISSLYEQANTHGISEEKLDTLLKSEEAKAYYNDILQELIKYKITGEAIDPELTSTLTSDFIAKVEKKYQLALGEREQQKLQDLAEQTVQAETSKLESNTTTEMDDEGVSLLKFMTSKEVQRVILILLTVELILIIICSFSKKSFFSYFSFIALTLTIFIATFTASFQFILLHKLTKATMIEQLSSWLQPILTKGYSISLICLGVTILFFVLHKVIIRSVKKNESIAI